MTKIGNNYGCKVLYELSDMNQPLGLAIGNILEVKEAIKTLNGHGPEDVKKLCIQSGAMLYHAAYPNIPLKQAVSKMKNTLEYGTAYRKFIDMVKVQGGNTEYIKNPELFKKSKYVYKIISEEKGILAKIKTLELGNLTGELGAKRYSLNANIDYSAGIILNHKVGDTINNDLLCTLYTDKELSESFISNVHKLFVIKK